MGAENKVEQLLLHLKAVNFNDDCRVQLTDAGLKQYHDEWARLGMEAPPLDKTEDGTRFELWRLMHTFGPLMYVGGPSLFKENTITIEGKGKGEKRSMNINDTIFVFVTPEGRRMYEEAYQGRPPELKMVGALTEMQFHEVSYIFGPKLYNGSTKLPIDTTFYLRPAQKK